MYCQSDQSGIETGETRYSATDKVTANRTNLELKRIVGEGVELDFNTANRTNLELKLGKRLLPWRCQWPCQSDQSGIETEVQIVTSS